MAVTRPLKEGSVTTYQQKVALGFPDILASEMDADLDTIYAAWNGGVNTANLVDGSVTFAKLAPDAQLWRDTGTALTPGTNFATRIVSVPVGGTAVTVGARTVKHRLCASPGVDSSYLTINAKMDSAGAWTSDDTAQPSWILGLRTADDFRLLRAVATTGAPVFTPLLTLDNAGNLNVMTLVARPTGATYSARLIGGGPSVNMYYSGGWQRDDTANAGFYLNADPGTDRLNMYRMAPAGGALTTPFVVTGIGDLTILGNTATKNTGTTWANPSDPRLKDDIAPYAVGLTEICRLDPITYRLKAQPDGPLCYGFDAEKVRDIFPECVSETRMKLSPDDAEETDGVLTFDMHPILIALVNAIRELNAKMSA
jgi:hypothetical protein